MNQKICRVCRQEVLPGQGHYELWQLSMPAHRIGYMCKTCNDKRFIVRIKTWFKLLYKKTRK